MHYLAININYKGHIMNNTDMNPFILRRTRGTPGKDGKAVFEEDFYMNQQRPSPSENGLLRCFGYGESLWRKGYFMKRHFSDDYFSFEYITEGNAELKCGNIRYKAETGSVLILRPGDDIILRCGTSGFIRKKCLLLEKELTAYICSNASLAGVNHIICKDTERLDKIYCSIKDCIQNGDEYIQQELGIHSYALIAELQRLALPQQYPVSLRKALGIIHSRLQEKHTLESLSIECQTSVRTLSRLFKSYLGNSPMDYIIERRLEQAKILLSVSNQGLKELAEECGYSNAAFFSRCFKKKYGISPGKHRTGRT